MTFMRAVLSAGIFVHFFNPALGHGYMSSPRSRNFVAAEDGVWWGGTEDNPEKENCPHCLNRGGTLARCGVNSGRNYDMPKNALGGLMKKNIQATYNGGSEIQIDAVLVAHHMGHFTFKACPISYGEVPQQSCFDQNPLEFVSDALYGAPKDPNYPDRAYIAPLSDPRKIVVSDSSGVSGMKFSYRFKLPKGISGDMVLIQFLYVTANSCTHPGYSEYPFPSADWRSSDLPMCGPFPLDGDVRNRMH